MALHRQNIVGPQVRKRRYELDWSQEQLAARLGRMGWDVSRGTLAKLEASVRCVSDSELLMLAKALGVKADDLFPRAGR
jgi:transcriptional regulator with XRE-family HTH domain